MAGEQPDQELGTTGRSVDVWLRAGSVGRPHGLDGSFLVTAPSSRLLQSGRTVTVGETAWVIERRAGHDARPIIRLAGCVTREQAQALRGQELIVERSQVPALGPDEWWAEDLEGLAVYDGGRLVGTVAKLLGLPSCEVLEVRRASGGETLLVPLVSDAVRKVDLDGGRIEIDLAFLGEG